MPKRIASIVVCVNLRPVGFKPSCAAQGSVGLADALEKGIAERRIDVALERICCLGHCDQGPTMRFAPGGDFLLGVTEADLPGILERLEKLCGRRDEALPDPLAALPPPGS